MRAPVISTLLAVALAGPARADMESLRQFLNGVEETTHVTAALRGDGDLEVRAGAVTRHDQLALILRPPADTYIELRREGMKALLLASGSTAFRVAKGGGKAGPFPLDAAFADSDFSREDLEPFRVGRFKDFRIADDTATELTVTMFPADSQYSLVVTTFDREKRVPIKTLYYRETPNNLVKMRRDTGHVLVGRKWMPAVITMESFKLRTQTTLRLRWSQNPTFPPELFDSAFLSRPSGIVWPATAPTPASPPA